MAGVPAAKQHAGREAGSGRLGTLLRLYFWNHACRILLVEHGGYFPLFDVRNIAGAVSL